MGKLYLLGILGVTGIPGLVRMLGVLVSYIMDSMPTRLTVLFGILRKILGMCAVRILGLLGLARYKG